MTSADKMLQRRRTICILLDVNVSVCCDLECTRWGKGQAVTDRQCQKEKKRKKKKKRKEKKLCAARMRLRGLAVTE